MSIPCIQCRAPTGMPELDRRSIPPGCWASLTVLCAECNAKRRTFAPLSPVYGWKSGLRLVPEPGGSK